MNKLIQLSDKVGISNDDISTIIQNKLATHSKFKTEVVAYYTDTGEELFRQHNIMTLAGGGFIARALFDIDEPEKTPTYNSALALDDEQPSNVSKTPEKVYLFCVGTDGCGRENSQVFAARYASWIKPDYDDTYGGIIPFRFTTADSDLTAVQRDYTKAGTYFGRKKNANSDGRIAYYFKKFDSVPTFTQQFTDGTPIDANVYTTQESTDTEVETIVSMQMSISKDDCRDFFFYGTGLNDARVNSMSLCVAYPHATGRTLAGGIKEYTYENIRPVTRLNYPSLSLIDGRLSLSIRYSIYL